MPASGTSLGGNFRGLKAEDCSIINLRGLRVLEDEKGQDLLKLLRKGGSGSSELEGVVNTLLQRIDTIEKYLQTLPPPVAAAGVKGEKGEKGDQGEPGEKGDTGPQGARGKGVSKLSEMTDVNLDGLDDGAVLAWSSKDKKWVVTLEE